MPAARADTSDGLTGPSNRRRRAVGRRVREAVPGLARRWLAGSDLRRARSLVPARVPAARGQPWQRAPRFGDAGFSLVEVMIAFVILLIVLVPIASVLTNSISQAASSRERLTALSVAEQYIEILNNSGPHLATGQPVVDTTVVETATPLVRSGVAYTVDSRFSWAAAHGKNPDLCTSGSAPKVMAVRVTVHWSHTTHEVTDSTIVNYPPAGLPTKGFLAVDVVGDPASGPPADQGVGWTTRVKTVPVTVQTPPAPALPTYTTTVYPDGYGCVFLQVAPGTYSVAVASPNVTPPWVVNADEATAQTQSPFTVDIGQVTLASFQYDQGAVVGLRYPSTTAVEGGVSCPAAGTILCLATGQSPTSTARPASTPVADVSVRTSSGWSVQHLSGMSRVAGTACAGSARCVAVGYRLTTYGSGAAVAAAASAPATAAAPSFGADAVPSGVTSLSAVSCPSAGTCLATGTGTAGPVLLTGTVGAGSVSWSADTLPAGVSALSPPTCASATACYAAATVSGAAAILSPSATTSHTWVADTLPATPATTAVGQIACPATTTCYATGSTASAPEILSLGSGTTWMADTMPAGVTLSSLGALTCPSSTTCYVAAEEATPRGALLSLSPPSAWALDAAPTTTAISQLGCTGANACIALGSTTTGPVVLRPVSATSWAAGTLPGTMTVDSLSGAVCPTSTYCVAVGTATSSGRTDAVILSLGTSGTWRSDTLPSSLQPVFFSGVDCTATVCTAPGATESGAVYLDGTVPGTAWSDGTPSPGVAGMYAAGVPIAASNPNLKTSSTLLVTAPASDAAQVGPLFPFAAGYSVAAAECASELATASTTVASAPGSTTATAALPMGLLPVAVTTLAGNPVGGASITATLLTKTGTHDPSVTTRGTCRPLVPLSGGSAPAAYTLERTGPLGLSAIDVVYDTYELTVTAPDGHTASRTVEVTPTATVATGVPRPLPVPVVVTVT